MFITLIYKNHFWYNRTKQFSLFSDTQVSPFRIPLRTLMIETVQLQRRNSNDFSVVLTLRSMSFDHCSFHEDNSFCIYCLRKMTIPKVANRVHELRVLLSRKSSVGHAHSNVFYLFFD